MYIFNYFQLFLIGYQYNSFYFLENNDYLQDLDLSWNQLRLCGAVAIGNSLQVRHFVKFIE